MVGRERREERDPLSTVNAPTAEHDERVAAIQRDLSRLRHVSATHAETVASQILEIQKSIAELVGVNAFTDRSTMESNV